MRISGQSDRLIQPKETEKVEVTVTSGVRPGSHIKKVSVSTNDRTQPTAQLECAANVLAAMRVDPADSVNFGLLKRNAPEQTKTLTITRGDGGPLNLKLTSPPHPQVEAELKEIEAGERYELTVTAKPPWTGGSLRTALTFETGVEQEPTRTIQVFASITPRLQTNPQRFVLRPGSAGEYDLSVRLMWDEEPGKVLEALSSDPDLNVRIDGTEDAQTLVMHVPAGYTPKKAFGEFVTVRTDDSAVPTLQVPIYCPQQPPGTPEAGSGAPGRSTAASPVAPGKAAAPMLRPTAVEPVATQPARP